MKWKDSGNFENPPPGSHVARCIQVIDLGTRQHNFKGETWASRDVRIVFELPETKMTGKYVPELKGKPFAVSTTMKQSLHSRSKLRPFLESWRGKKFTNESLQAHDPKNIVGAACRLTLIEDSTAAYVNIDSIAPLEKRKKIPAQINPSIFFSLDPEEFDNKVFSQLSEKTQEAIKNTPEWSHLFSGGQQPDPDLSGDAPKDGEGVESDDVPF